MHEAMKIMLARHRAGKERCPADCFCWDVSGYLDEEDARRDHLKETAFMYPDLNEIVLKDIALTTPLDACVISHPYRDSANDAAKELKGLRLRATPPELYERITKAIQELNELARTRASKGTEKNRLLGKVEGVKLVQSYLQGETHEQE